MINYIVFIRCLYDIVGMINVISEGVVIFKRRKKGQKSEVKLARIASEAFTQLPTTQLAILVLMCL